VRHRRDFHHYERAASFGGNVMWPMRLLPNGANGRKKQELRFPYMLHMRSASSLDPVS
jgi:hypothetical protein